MNQDLNPFTPGAGLTPPELTGRDQEIIDFDRLAARSKMRLTDRGLMLYGLRGVGKTVLLRRLETHAERSGWLTLRLEGSLTSSAQKQLRIKLARDLAQQTRVATQGHTGSAIQRAIASIAELSLTLGFAQARLVLKPKTDEPAFTTGVLDIDFPEAILNLAEALKELPQPKAIGFFIDEIQDLDSELLDMLLTTQHEAGQRELPFYIIGAGLPSVPTRLGEIKTYAERLFSYREIGALTPDATRRAFIEPIRRPGGHIVASALEKATVASQGYPYFIQQYGQAIWNSAAQQTITDDDVLAGLAVGRSELDSGFYLTRWQRTTDAEQDYLVAMARVMKGQAARTGEIAETLNKTANGTSVVRKSLIEKGLVYSPGVGQLAFTVPGMQDFVLRQAGQV